MPSVFFVWIERVLKHALRSDIIIYKMFFLNYSPQEGPAPPPARRRTRGSTTAGVPRPTRVVRNSFPFYLAGLQRLAYTKV